MTEAALQHTHKKHQDVTVKFVTFLLGNESYAVHVSSVNEVLRYTEITPVPGAPGYILGIINLRGDVLTVIDTREVFGLPPQVVTSHSRIVVVELADCVVGMLVDRVAEVVDLHESGIEASPNTGNDHAARFMQGVYHHNDRLLVLVNFSKLSSL